MDIKAINNVSYVQFQGTKKHNKERKAEKNYPQMTEPMSKDASKYMKSLAIAAIISGAGVTGMTSCDTGESYAYADSNTDSYAYAYAIGCNHHHHDTTTVVHDTITNTDTVFITKPDTVYLEKDKVPFAIMDSLVAQGVNIGATLDGPGLGTHNLVYVGSKTYNRYDGILYESKIEKERTSQEQLSVVTTLTHTREGNKKTYMRALVTDDPGEGIRIDRQVSDDKRHWLPAGYEIRSNGARGNSIGKNMIYQYDNDYNLVYKGEFSKGESFGTFLYGKIVVDPETGEVVRNEDNKPELAEYDFNQTVIYTDIATPEKIENPF